MTDVRKPFRIQMMLNYKRHCKIHHYKYIIYHSEFIVDVYPRLAFLSKVEPSRMQEMWKLMDISQADED